MKFPLQQKDIIRIIKDFYDGMSEEAIHEKYMDDFRRRDSNYGDENLLSDPY